MRNLFLLLLTFQFSPLFSQTIKMEKKNEIFEIPCKVNGLNLKFIFDTGASDVSISLSEALFMLKNGYLESEDIIGREGYKMANGAIDVGTEIIIRKLEIGNKELLNIRATIVHTLDAPLLLGQSALSRLGNFKFDYLNPNRYSIN